MWHIRRPVPEPAALAAAVEAIRAAARPLIVAGGGVIYAEADRGAAPLRRGDRHPGRRHPGGQGRASAATTRRPWAASARPASPAANALARDADLVIGVGTRYSDFTTASGPPSRTRTSASSTSTSPPSTPPSRPASCWSPTRATGLEALTAALAGYRVDDGLPPSTARAPGDDWNAVVDEAYHLDHRPLPAQTEVLGALNEVGRRRATWWSTRPARMPGDLQKLWRAADPEQYHVEYGYSCMGYEIAGALGIKMAAPDREVFALVGDGSYLMMATEIVTAVSGGRQARSSCIVQNHGFASIGGLSEKLGSQRFGTSYRYRDDDDRPARRRQAADRPRRQRGEPRRRRHPGRRRSRSCATALRPGPGLRPAPPPSTSRPTRWRRCRPRTAGGTCRSRRCPTLDSTQQARKTLRGHKAKQRPLPLPRRRRMTTTCPGSASAPPRTRGACGSPTTRTRSAGSSTSTRCARAGYVWTELGPQGFLPQDPARLRDELDSRGLKVCGGTVFAGLHRGADALKEAIEAFGREARLLAAVGARYLVAPARAVHRHAHRRGHRAGERSIPSSGATSSRAPTSWAGSCSRSTASSWCSIRTPTPTSTPRSGSSGS